jgi:hypothetical protein
MKETMELLSVVKTFTSTRSLYLPILEKEAEEERKRRRRRKRRPHFLFRQHKKCNVVIVTVIIPEITTLTQSTEGS